MGIFPSTQQIIAQSYKRPSESKFQTAFLFKQRLFYFQFGHAAHIRLQRGRNINAAVGVLMVFQNRHQSTADCQARAVQSMYQTVFTVFIFETRFHAASLEIFAVGAAGNFRGRCFAQEPRLPSRRFWLRRNPCRRYTK